MQQGSQPSFFSQTSRFYEIRLESIGGLGAHLAGQMLAEAGVLGMGLNGAHFSSYGSEKKGAPVKSYVRLGPPGKSLRITSPVREPDLVAVFHEAVLTDPSVIAGLKPGGTLVINTVNSPESIAAQHHLPGVRILTVAAIDIAVQEKSRVNTAMLGAICRATPVIETEQVRAVIAETFVKKYPHLVEANLRTFDRGYAEVIEHVAAEPPENRSAAARTGASGPVVGYRTAPIGGVLPTPGNTMHKDVSACRQGYLPVLERSLCVDCAICDLVCPDFCFVWEPTGRTINNHPALELRGIDYQYCKGCMACVQECPTGALTKEREVGDIAESRRIVLFTDKPRPGGIPAGAEALSQSGWGDWAANTQRGGSR